MAPKSRPVSRAKTRPSRTSSASTGASVKWLTISSNSRAYPGRGHAHGGADRGQRHAAATGRREDAKLGVAQLHTHMRQRDTQLLGGDLRQDGARAGADILRAGQDDRRAIGQQLGDGLRGRSAIAAPDLARHADAAPQVATAPARKAPRLVVARGPADALRADLIRLKQRLGRVGPSIHELIVRRVVLDAEAPADPCPSACASSSMATSIPPIASTTPGARNADCVPRFVRTGRSTVRTFAHRYSSLAARLIGEHPRAERASVADRAQIKRGQRAIASSRPGGTSGCSPGGGPREILFLAAEHKVDRVAQLLRGIGGDQARRGARRTCCRTRHPCIA